MNDNNQKIIMGFGATPMLALGMVFYASIGVIPRIEFESCSGQKVTISADHLIARNEDRLEEVLKTLCMEAGEE